MPSKMLTLTLSTRNIYLDSSVFAKNSSGNVTVTTREGLPFLVNRNVFFPSHFLASLLDLSPCVTAGLIIPDAGLATLNILIKLLSGETVRDPCSTDDVQMLAKMLGIDMTLTVTSADADESEIRERLDLPRPRPNAHKDAPAEEEDALPHRHPIQSPRKKRKRTMHSSNDATFGGQER